MKIEMRKFRIGTLAKKLNVERFVIRFWEKEFEFFSYRSTGKQRFYTEKELKKFETIKELLYEKGYTIAGAKKIFKQKTKLDPHSKESHHQNQTIVASSVTTFDAENSPPDTPETTAANITAQIIELQKKLIKLRKLLQ